MIKIQVSTTLCLLSLQLNMRTVIVHLPQFVSSEPSAQSLWRSHFFSRRTHSPLLQVNCLAEQGLGTRGRLVGVIGGSVEEPKI